MAFLVRKIIKRDKLYESLEEKSITEISSDIPTTEFRTTAGNLSTWRINSIDEFEKAALAIAVSSTDISRMDFIVIDTEILERNGLSYEKTYAGMDLPIPDLQELHVDITNLTIGKLCNCTKVYQEVFEIDDNEGKYIVRLSAGEIKELLKKAIRSDRIDKTKASGKILEAIEKLSA